MRKIYAAAFLLAMAALPAAGAAGFNALYSFTGGADGGYPEGVVTLDSSGNLYGTTNADGQGYGTVFKLAPSGSNWALTTLYSFTGQNGDGSNPSAGVIFGPDGSLYGTTIIGGNQGCGGYGCGTVFKLTNSNGHWTESLLYQFTGGSDGGNPGQSRLIFDPSGNILGTTYQGGNNSGCGTVYKLTNSNGQWTESTLYQFSGGADGCNPDAGVTLDSSGNLYGTTEIGGSNNNGTVYQLKPSGSGWTKNTLYTFQGANDGENPFASLIIDNSGNLYGATNQGGTGQGGTAFELTPSNGSWIFNLIYGFNAGTNGGEGPQGALLRDTAGNLYGTTYSDGAHQLGSAFKLTPSNGSWTYTSLHDFTGHDDGQYPDTNLVSDANGNLFGMTQENGINGNGVIFEIAPNPPTLTSMNPNTDIAGGSEFVLTVTGTNFVSNSVVQWNGSALATTYVSGTQVTATVPASDIVSAGVANVTVSNPAPNGGTSNTLQFAITIPVQTPGFVTGDTLGTPRNNYSGWVGMQVQVGASPLTVSALGRIFVTGNNQPHTVKLVLASTGQDVPNGSVTFTPSGTNGQFSYGSLQNNVTLNANTLYYLVSQETSGGDQWYDYNTVVTPAPVGSIPSAEYSPDSHTWYPKGTSNNSYGPVDFLYNPPTLTTLSPNAATAGGSGFTLTVTGTNFANGAVVQWNGSPLSTTYISGTQVTATVPASDIVSAGVANVTVSNPAPGGGTSNSLPFTITTPVQTPGFITGDTLGTPRNNYSGWVGMQVQVGASPLTVSALGRIFVTGNNQPHTVKLVLASTGQDVPNGSVTFTPSGTNGQFSYGSLQTNVTLNANTLYYLVSQEAAGGDQWYDYINTWVTPASVGSIPGAVFSPDSQSWNLHEIPNNSYGPVDFLYTGPGNPDPTLASIAPSTATVGVPTTLVLTGTGFLSGVTTCNYNNLAHSCTVNSGTSIAMTLNSSDVGSVGPYPVSVTNPAPGGGTSSSINLYVLPQATSFVASDVLGTQRNDFTGWVGMEVQVGTTPLTVSALGRIYISGNTQPHTVKFVVASSSQDVPGGSVTFTPTGINGQFSYALLQPAVTLNANTLYYLVSEETSGGDEWYNWDSTVTPTSVGTVPGAVFSTTGSNWSFHQSPDQSYGPVDFQYAIGTGVPPVLTGITPVAATVGDPDTLITVIGSNFEYGAVVTWNGTPLVTQFVNVSSLTATIPALDLTTPLTANIGVNNSDGGVSNTLGFQVVVPAGQPQFGTLPSQIPLNYTIQVTASGNPVEFDWTFTPMTGSQSQGAQGLQSYGSGGSPARVSTPSGALSLTTVPSLGLGSYQISVVAKNLAGKASAPGMADVTIINGDFSAVRVYPNPWRSDQAAGHPNITFDGLPNNVTIKLFTTSGHWIKTLPTASGSVTWDRTNNSGETVASGVYWYLITDGAGNNTHGEVSIIK